MILDACIGGVITHTGKVLAGWTFGKPKVGCSRNSMKCDNVKTYLVVPTLIKAASVTPLVYRHIILSVCLTLVTHRNIICITTMLLVATSVPTLN